MTWTFPTAPVRPAATSLEQTVTALIVAFVALAIILGQFGMMLLSWWPSSPFLWQLYFEILRPLDLFYRLLSKAFGDVSLPAFSALVAAVAAICLGAALSRRRLLRALSHHTLFAAAALLCYCSSGHQHNPAFLLGAESQPVAVAALMLGVFPLFQCLRIHRDYYLTIATGRSSARLVGHEGRSLSMLRRAWRTLRQRRGTALLEA
jgi:hypothetical protein